MTQNEISKDWFTASACGENNSCVQVRIHQSGAVDVRNSTDPEGPMVSFTREEWAAFLTGTKEGEFDLS
jgi:hypothetical protein